MCLYVRDLTLAEGRRLTRVLKTTKTAAYLRRAQVVAFSGQGMRARAIAGRLYLHEEYVRELIRRFNAGGFAALRPRKASGRPAKYAPEEISVMLEVAGTRPHDLGLPFTVWSLRKLAAHLVRGGVVKELHATTLGRILRDQGFSFQRTKTWKESPDPDFAAKKTRLCALPGRAAERPRDLFRRIRAHRSAPLPWPCVAQGPAPGAVARHVPAPPWHPPIPRGVRRRGQPTHDAVLPTQAMSRSAAVPQAHSLDLPTPNAPLPRPRQLLAAHATRGDRLGRRPQRGARVHADLRLVAESDRSDLLGRPLFRAGQLRLSGP